MRTTAIINLKGGVAKTTTALNMAAILAKDYKQRVLLVDADSQCNCTEFFQRGNAHPGTLADMLRGLAPCIEHSRFDGVDLLPGDDSLMDLDLTKIETGSASAVCLRELASELDGRYDRMIIDCPPAFNAASAAALVAADEVIIPIKLDAFSLRGMANIMQQVSNMRKINDSLTVAGILPTMWYKSDNIIEAEKMLREFGLPVLPHVRRTNKVDDMTFAQEPLVISSPKSAAGVDYRRVVAALM